MRLITGLLAIAILAVAPVLGNTEILNLPSHPLCPPLSSIASLEALEVSRDWPVLSPGVRPNFFTIEAQGAAKTGGAQGEDGRWFRLALQEQGGVLEKGWTVRASWPANHHVSLSLDVYTPEEMLQKRSSGSQLDTHRALQPEDTVVPCSTLYLRLSAEVEGVSIPPSPLHGAAAPASDQLNPVVRLLGTLASYYLDPISATPRVQDGLGSEVHPAGETNSLTPIHLTLEPLLFGVAPRSITLHLLGVLVVIVGGLGAFLQAGGVEKVGSWVAELVQGEERGAHGK